jgi:tRNA-2-methylthio-N6-dimethylallyladenosine synthase
MKSFHIITFGCQMNEHDSERMTGILEGRGCFTSDAADADLIILNTCSIRQKAEQKFYSELGRLRQLKAERPGLKIAVAGCIAQQEGANLLSRAPYIDMVFGPSDIAKLPEIVTTGLSDRSPVIDTTGDPHYHLKHVPTSRADQIKAWVSIMYGCDNFCTYCVVPYLRGRERSRPSEDIVSEVRDLSRKGYKEVTLLGQNVNSYGRGLEKDMDFPALLERVNDDTGIERIRFVTSHPRDLSDKLVNAISSLPRVCESLHLPVQSGANAVLHAMNRQYTHEEYLVKVRRLRQAVPDITLTTDIIVGFPGETARNFEMTVDLLEEVRFDNIFAFKYSERPGTAALKLPDRVSEDEKEKRLTRVLALQKGITSENNKKQLHTTKEILIDGFSKRGGKLTGRTRGNKVVNVEGSADLIGSLAQVEIIASGANSLTGQICE